MKQVSLFDDCPGDGSGALTPLGLRGSARATKAQNQFNKHLARIAEQRRDLAQWQAFVPIYHQTVAAGFDPLIARLRDRRIAMARLLDRTMQGDALTRRERVKVEDILLGQLSVLLIEAHDAELVQLYDNYSDLSFADTQQQNMELMQALASDAFDIELDTDGAPNTPEESAELIGASARAAHMRQPKQERPKSAKSTARAALREQAAQGASRSVREVYRKLASELHPDRERDPQQHKRKTALMQSANRAYAARDLFGLLELHLSIARIGPEALAGMAQERLAHYNQALREQSQRLQEDLSEVTRPFVAAMGVSPGRHELTPEMVRRALDNDVRELRSIVKSLEADLAAFQDIRQLKASLKHYRAGRASAGE